MSDDSRQVDVAGIVRVSQIIVGAMFAGVLVFMVVALVARQPAAAAPWTMTAVVGLFAAAGMVGRVVVLAGVAGKARRDLLQGVLAMPGSATANLPAGLERDAKYLAMTYQTRTIISSAICEGMAFFAIVAYIAEGNPWSLGLAGFLALCLLLNLPNSSRVGQWIEAQQHLLQVERMRAS